MVWGTQDDEPTTTYRLAASRCCGPGCVEGSQRMPARADTSGDHTMLRPRHVILGAFILCLGASCKSAGTSDASTQDDAAAETGRYMDGVYRCCAKGEGRECCGELSTTMCYEFGGLYGDCRAEGELLEGKISCAKCCPGLEEATTYMPPEDGGVCEPGVVSLRVCIRCGDGACGKGEDRCTCPADCGI